MIMKDEEDELPLVIASVANLVDEMVIYDTGSSDRSIVLARELGATVIEGYWDEDFSRARNEALRHCTGDWILWLDADEALHGDASALRTRLELDQTFDAYLLPIESIEGTGLGVHSTFHAARLFRRRHCHWRGPIHEQIARQEDGSYPPTMICPELRILHRGYTTLKRDHKDLIERNLHIARQALDDPGVDHSLALFDYGRTLTESNDPKSGIAPLRRAAETTTLATVRRAALRNIFYVHLATKEFDQAEVVLDELRAQLTTTISTDVMLVKLLLWRGDYEECLEIIGRLPFSATDEDGFELGRHSVAWAKAQVLDALGRPSEAADALLDALRTHGQLDENLGALVGLLQKAGRALSEIASIAPAETMPVLVASASVLPVTQADAVLTAFADCYPDRLEPLAAARQVATRLAIPRAMWWSDRLRRVGLAQSCPLVTIVNNELLEPLFRLRGAAGGFLSFHDQRLIPPARAVLSTYASEDQTEMIEQVRGISPELATILSAPTQAIHLSRSGTPLGGFVNFATEQGEADTIHPDRLPLGDATVHELFVEDVLASVPHERAINCLAEWARVLRDGGWLRLTVPNFEAVGDLLARSPSQLRRLLFGGRRYGVDGEDEANVDAWSPEELKGALAGVGFVVEELVADEVITLTARRIAVLAKKAVGDVPPVSVLIVGENGRDDLLRRLRDLAATDAGLEFETVVLVNGPDAESLALLPGLSGDVTVARSPLLLDSAVAVDEAARLARAKIVVVTSARTSLTGDWLARLVSPLRDPVVAITGAAVVDHQKLIVHAGLALVGDATKPHLETVACSAYLRAEAVLSTDATVDAVGAEAVAVRRAVWHDLRGLTPGWSEGDAMVDLCLRARAINLKVVVPAGCAVTAKPATLDAASNERLTWRWVGRTALRAPVQRHISASSLLPSSSLIERVSTVMEVPATPRIGGVNLIGDFNDTRIAAHLVALTDAGLPISRLQWAGGVPTRIGGDEPFTYTTTLLALDGDQLLDYIGEVGIDSLRTRRTIVAWEWPLEHAPINAATQAAMVSEVWVPSKFTERALKSDLPRPVRCVSPRVAVPNLSRSDAHLPEGFVFAVVARLGRGRPGDEALANPVATVTAFCRAFSPQSGPTLGVVLHGQKTQRAADACRAVANGRPDVLIIETTDAAVAAAASVTADCLVSLHRASAFGHDIARALAAGCPVVATGYGGPMDYLTDTCAELIPYTTTQTTAALHPFPAGTQWAEPDIEVAIETLQLVYDDYTEAVRKARYGRSIVTRCYGSKEVDHALRRHLSDSFPDSSQRNGRVHVDVSR
jgi:hypothetical protein